MDSSSVDTRTLEESIMTNHTKQMGKYMVYGFGLVATVATSPSYNFYGAMGSDNQVLSIAEDSEFIHFTVDASVVDNSDEPMQLLVCGWEPLIELPETVPDDIEVFIWQVTGWSQEAFDEAYANALSEINTEDGPEDVEDTGQFDTGVDSLISETTDRHAATVYDPRFTLNPEHDVFYGVMETFSTSIGYRVFEDGELVPTFYPEDIELFMRNDFPFPTECDEHMANFVITVLGQSLDTSFDLTMMRHEGVTVASEVFACAQSHPDYSDMNINVTLVLGEQ
jgi:hypothetical protein